MNEEQIACMPLVENVQNPESKSWTKALGIIKLSSCTECALKAMYQEEMV